MGGGGGKGEGGEEKGNGGKERWGKQGIKERGRGEIKVERGGQGEREKGNGGKGKRGMRENFY